MQCNITTSLVVSLSETGFELADVVFLQAECDCEVLQ